MANINSHPQDVPVPGSTTNDASLNCSITVFGDGPSYVNGGALQIRGDYAIWDATASAYVSIHNQNINAGTTGCPKVGQ